MCPACGSLPKRSPASASITKCICSACRAPSRPASIRSRRACPISRPIRPWPRNGRPVLAATASRSASPGRAIPIPRWIWRAPLRLPPSRRLPQSRTSGSSASRRDLAPGSLPIAGWKVETLGEDFDAGPNAFIDTAAVMANLDLIVSVDTSVAHLAGAMGRPVFVALKHVPEWRWMLDRADLPWYPTMRLFRQPKRGDWTGVFESIAKAVAALSNAPAAPLQIPAPIGELFDKITILEIKAGRIPDAGKRTNVERELARCCNSCGKAAGFPAPASTGSPRNLSDATPRCGTSRTPFVNVSASAISARLSSSLHAASIRRTTSAPRSSARSTCCAPPLSSRRSIFRRSSKGRRGGQGCPRDDECLCAPETAGLANAQTGGLAAMCRAVFAAV